jgi:TRAP-type C4-dicarboxylate transport system substrate-binding protein
MAFNPMLTAAQEVELKLASWGPAKHYVAEARNVWIAEVNKALAGKVKIIDFSDEQRYGPKDVHNAVAKGQVDLGVVLQPRMLEMVPLAQGVYLPFVFDSIDDAAKAYTGESLALIEKAMEKKRLKLVYVSYLDPVHIFSSKGSVKTKNDFKGLHILSASPIFSEVMAKLGAVPDTSIPQKEQYMALKRSAFDAIASSVVGGYFQGMVAVAPYITKMNMAYPTILVCMNLEKWNSLPKEAQKVMRSIG